MRAAMANLEWYDLALCFPTPSPYHMVVTWFAEMKISQSIECDHLNEIGMVVRLVEFISFTFGDKEMILGVGQTVVTATSIPFKCSIYKDDKDNDKGSKSRSQNMMEQAYNEDKDQEHSSLNDKSNLTDLMKECHQ
ncbi:hypothetical protein Tco_0592695 [Tanacetum coccineum]